MLRTPAATSRSQTSCAASAGVGDDADRDALLAHHVVQRLDRPHRQAGDATADAGRVGVEQRGDPEAAVVEAAVAGQRLPEVADADQHHGPALPEAEGAADVHDQLRDVVADARVP
jgi:hypothetical protein